VEEGDAVDASPQGNARRRAFLAQEQLAERLPTRETNRLSSPMHYVYILISVNEPLRFYVGSTFDLKKRLGEHNQGKSTHTAKHRPWKLHWYAAFPDKRLADSFESYLKSGSGRRFQKRHLGLPI